MKCVFCNLDKKEKIIFQTKNFIFLKSKHPIIAGHCLLISKKHIRSEKEIPSSDWKDFMEASKKAYSFIERKYKKAPLVYVNPPQQQFIKHYHKHFLPGIFGVLGAADSLRNFLKNNENRRF